ncbi:MFS transporter [uncultured Albimonas sp.]|uniref:MFS transporter n=1 Tax=uncultured Albimonas sp. TaxID=1331701 RepID=UPI0030EDCE50
MSAPSSQHPGFPRVALFALGGAYFVLGCASLGAVGMVEEIQAGLGVSAAAVASLVTVFSVVYALTAPAAQAVAGHLRRRAAIAGGLTAIAAGCVISAAAPSYPVLIAARLLMGLGAAMTGPFLTAAAATLVAPEDRARALAMVFGGVTASSVLGVPLASFLAQTLGWRWAWGALALAAVICAVVVWQLLPAANKGSRASIATLMAVLRNRPLAMTVAACGVSVVGMFSTYALIAVWLAEVGRLEASMIPPALFMFGFGGIAGNIFAARAVSAMGARGAAIASMVTTLLVMLCLPFAADWPAWTAIALMTLWAGSGMMIMVPVQSLLVALDPERASLTLALNSSAVYLGMAVGATVAGAVYEAFGPAVLPFCSAAMVLAAIGLLVFSGGRVVGRD